MARAQAARPDGDSEPAPSTACTRALSAGARASTNALAREGLELDTLSLGMSDDLEAANRRGLDDGARRHCDLRRAAQGKGRCLNIAFVGGGNMANALIGGLLAKGAAPARSA
jgi:hypothetical protein